MLERASILVLALAGIVGLTHLGHGMGSAIASTGEAAPTSQAHCATMAISSQAGLRMLDPVALLVDNARNLGTAARDAMKARTSLGDLAARFPESAVGRMAREGRYFTRGELLGLHVRGSRYHDVPHSAEVSATAHALAKARGLSDDQALFLSEVALIHDIDPLRSAGTKPRVAATLKLLPRLAKRMGWSTREEAMAAALIQRTQFPFKGSSVAKYERLVRAIPSEADRRFVLREAPLLSEYADKGSNYMLQGFQTTRRKVLGLAREIDPTGALRPQDLYTGDFLGGLGTRAAFAQDRAVAARVLGEGRFVKLLSREALAKLMPDWMTQLEDNKASFERQFPRK